MAKLKIESFKEETPADKELIKEKARILWMSVDSNGERRFGLTDIADEIIKWRGYKARTRAALITYIGRWRDKGEWAKLYEKAQTIGLERAAIEDGSKDIVSKIADDQNEIYKMAFSRLRTANTVLRAKLRREISIKDDDGKEFEYDDEVPYNALAQIIRDSENTVMKILKIDEKDPVKDLMGIVEDLPEDIALAIASEMGINVQ